MSRDPIDWAELPDDDDDLWRPEKVGDQISGVLIDFNWQTGKNGVTPVMTFATDEGQRTYWAGQKDVRRKLKQMDVQINDIVTIRFTDELDVGAPSKMKLFDVTVEDRDN